LNNFKYIYNLLFVVIGLLLFSCEESKHQENNSLAKIKTDSLTYLNHSDSAKYVGINTCRLCHQDIYNTFIETGMGKSFDIASKSKSSGNYHSSVIYDKIGDYHYKAYWEKDSLKILEYRLQGKDTVHELYCWFWATY
jgi:hypothetical protein